MAVKIVDASAIAAFVFAEPKATHIEFELSGHRLAAPTLLPFEMSSICLKKLRVYPDNRDNILARFAGYADIPIELHSSDPDSIVETARATGLSAYDASYLLLAVRMSADLITLDEKLRRAAEKL